MFDYLFCRYILRQHNETVLTQHHLRLYLINFKS